MVPSLHLVIAIKPMNVSWLRLSAPPEAAPRPARYEGPSCHSCFKAKEDMS